MGPATARVSQRAGRRPVPRTQNAQAWSDNDVDAVQPVSPLMPRRSYVSCRRLVRRQERLIPIWPQRLTWMFAIDTRPASSEIFSSWDWKSQGYSPGMWRNHPGGRQMLPRACGKACPTRGKFGGADQEIDDYGYAGKCGKAAAFWGGLQMEKRGNQSTETPGWDEPSRTRQCHAGAA